MKVFISWSGARSRRLAEILSEWLPMVIQAVKPYYSADDIAKGTRWSSEIARELEAATLGILCLTRSNLEAPWMMFEAGALSKNLDASRVCPILFGVEPTDVKGPLVQFQSARFEKEEMRRVMQMLNTQLGDSALKPEVFESVFETWWPKLDATVGQELTSAPPEGEHVRRSERDLLEEVLTITRGLAREAVPEETSRALVASYGEVVESAVRGDNATLRAGLQRMAVPLGLLPRHRSILGWLFGSLPDPVLTNAVKMLESQTAQPHSTGTPPQRALEAATMQPELLAPQRKSKRRGSARRR